MLPVVPWCESGISTYEGPDNNSSTMSMKEITNIFKPKPVEMHKNVHGSFIGKPKLFFVQVKQLV